jgi:soluble lytic murein transglycosylase-like protein
LDLKPSLILAVIKLESNFNKYEVGEDNDRGYMQIIPSTEKWLAKKYGYKLGLKYNPKRIFEPEYNIGLGAIYLSILKESYGENYNRILSEYNRGPYNLREYYNKHKTYVTSYSRGVLRREKAFLVFND